MLASHAFQIWKDERPVLHDIPWQKELQSRRGMTAASGRWTGKPCCGHGPPATWRLGSHIREQARVAWPANMWRCSCFNLVTTTLMLTLNSTALLIVSLPASAPGYYGVAMARKRRSPCKLRHAACSASYREHRSLERIAKAERLVELRQESADKRSNGELIDVEGPSAIARIACYWLLGNTRFACLPQTTWAEDSKHSVQDIIECAA